MPAIKLDLEAAQATTNAMAACYEDIQSAISRLDSYINTLQQGSMGKSIDQFFDEYNLWRSRATQVTGSLDELRTRLERESKQWHDALDIS